MFESNTTVQKMSALFHGTARDDSRSILLTPNRITEGKKYVEYKINNSKDIINIKRSVNSVGRRYRFGLGFKRRDVINNYRNSKTSNWVWRWKKKKLYQTTGEFYSFLFALLSGVFARMYSIKILWASTGKLADKRRRVRNIYVYQTL